MVAKVAYLRCFSCPTSVLHGIAHAVVSEWYQQRTIVVAQSKASGTQCSNLRYVPFRTVSSGLQPAVCLLLNILRIGLELDGDVPKDYLWGLVAYQDTVQAFGYGRVSIRDEGAGVILGPSL